MTMAVAKLIAHPLIVWALATYVFDVPPLWAKVAIICAATPVGVNVYLFGERYGAGQAESAAAILISTVFSMLTLTVILGVLGVNPG
jgi:predicted permease